MQGQRLGRLVEGQAQHHRRHAAPRSRAGVVDEPQRIGGGQHLGEDHLSALARRVLERSQAEHALEVACRRLALGSAAREYPARQAEPRPQPLERADLAAQRRPGSQLATLLQAGPGRLVQRSLPYVVTAGGGAVRLRGACGIR